MKLALIIQVLLKAPNVKKRPYKTCIRNYCRSHGYAKSICSKYSIDDRFLKKKMKREIAEEKE